MKFLLICKADHLADGSSSAIITQIQHKSISKENHTEKEKNWLCLTKHLLKM